MSNAAIAEAGMGPGGASLRQDWFTDWMCINI